MSLDKELNQASYAAESLPDGRTRFTVTPAPVPRLGCLLMTLAGLGAILGGILFSVLGPLMFVGLVGGAILGWKGGALFWKRSLDKRRAPGGTFIAGPAGLEVNGQTIPADRLHQLVIRNGMDLARETSVVTNATTAQRHANIAIAAQVSYMLQAESGGRATTLAGGMTETCATGLRADVARAMGMS